jgi:hypothetical protein
MLRMDARMARARIAARVTFEVTTLVPPGQHVADFTFNHYLLPLLR